jgi:hypothetical protein
MSAHNTAPHWMITFGDLLTLLVCMFIHTIVLKAPEWKAEQPINVNTINGLPQDATARAEASIADDSGTHLATTIVEPSHVLNFDGKSHRDLFSEFTVTEEAIERTEQVREIHEQLRMFNGAVVVSQCGVELRKFLRAASLLESLPQKRSVLSVELIERCDNKKRGTISVGSNT